MEPDRSTVQRSRLDEVVDVIREGILSGEYYPAQRLVESRIARELGVGRHIVRLALERLQVEGLVVIEPNRGAAVARLTLEEALDILLAREVLEGAAARLAAERATPGQLARLSELVASMKEAVALREYNRYTQYNGLFHQVIYEACGSKKIPELIGVLRARMVSFQFRTVLVPGRAEQSLEEHRRILEALRQRDPQAAEEAMREHIATLRRVIAEAWQLLRR